MNTENQESMGTTFPNPASTDHRTGGGNRKPYHVLTREDRAKGGARSASSQRRDEFGQFAGRTAIQSRDGTRHGQPPGPAA